MGVAVLLKLPAHQQTDRGRIDIWGMLLLGLATTAIVLIGTWGGAELAWTSPTILALAALALVSAALFLWVQTRTAEPVLPLMLFRSRNFNLTMIAGLITGVAMFGALSYMPTYLQMVTGYSPAEAGLLMIPMMGTLLATSIIVGRRVSITGRYKRFMVIGSLFTSGALGLLSTVHSDPSVLLICIYLAVLGLGLGMTMQLLTLVAQNSFRLRHVGTATAGQNYFRQVGATLGAAVVGSLFASRLTSTLSDELPSAALGEGGANSLTPELVSRLPDSVRVVVVEAYNEALMPLFLWMMPLALVATVMLLFIREAELSKTLDR